MIQDQTISFTLKNDQPVLPIQYTTQQSGSCFDEVNLYKNSVIPIDLLKQYHKVQHSLDPIFDNNQLNFYKAARDEIFPKAKRGSQNHANRAGDKVEEIFSQTKILQNLQKEFVFADVCAAPGSWSLFVLQRFLQCKGVGMSMPVEGTPKEKTWYPDLQRSQRFKITFGEDETGNVYKNENLQKFNQVCKTHFLSEDTQNVDLFMCDGGFEIQKDPQGKHCEHLQEIITQRLLTSEFLFAMRCLKNGGCFVCKMYDSVSLFSVQLLYLMFLQSTEFQIVKPEHSRVINAEKYVVFTGFKQDVEILGQIQRIYENWAQDVVYDRIFVDNQEFTKFMHFINKVNDCFIKRTICALDLVIKRVYAMIDEERRFKQNPREALKYQENDRKNDREYFEERRYDRGYQRDERTQQYQPYQNDVRYGQYQERGYQQNYYQQNQFQQYEGRQNEYGQQQRNDEYRDKQPQYGDYSQRNRQEPRYGNYRDRR